MHSHVLREPSLRSMWSSTSWLVSRSDMGSSGGALVSSTLLKPARLRDISALDCVMLCQEINMLMVSQAMFFAERRLCHVPNNGLEQCCGLHEEAAHGRGSIRRLLRGKHHRSSSRLSPPQHSLIQCTTHLTSYRRSSKAKLPFIPVLTSRESFLNSSPTSP